MKLKLAISFLSEAQYSGAWKVFGDDFVEAAKGLDIDTVLFHYRGEIPSDIGERVEVYRGAPGDSRRRSDALLYVAWPELFSEAIDWGDYLGSIEGINSVDLCFADSYTIATWLQKFTTRPIIVCPPGYNSKLFVYVERDYESTPFTFLFAGALVTHLAFWEIPQAFAQAFPEEDDVRLVMALGGERGSWGRLSEEWKHDKRVIVDTKRRSHEEMIDLFAQAHCFVRPACADNVSLTTLEALATGLPAIFASHLWYREFIPPQACYFVRLSNSWLNIKERGFWPYEGWWRVPDMGDLSSKMREVYENKDLAKQKGRFAATYVRKYLSWEAALGRMCKLFSKILEDGDYLQRLQSFPLEFLPTYFS